MTQAQLDTLFETIKSFTPAKQSRLLIFAKELESSVNENCDEIYSATEEELKSIDAALDSDVTYSSEEYKNKINKTFAKYEYSV
jgi:hypothetical protein